MATRTWNGATDSFNNASDWSPVGVPTSGDTAVINSGTVSITSNVTGVAIQLVQASGSATSTGLNFANTTLDNSSSLTVTNNNTYNATSPTIGFSGTVTLGGTESFNGTKIGFTISSGSTLVNAGVLNF